MHAGQRLVELAHLLPAVGQQFQAPGQGAGAGAQQDVPGHATGQPDVVAALAPAAHVVRGGLVHPPELGGALGRQTQRGPGLLGARGLAPQDGGEQLEGALVLAPVVPVPGLGSGRAGPAVAHVAGGQDRPGGELGASGIIAAGGGDELVDAFGDRLGTDAGRRVAPLHVRQQRLDLGQRDLRVRGGVVDDPLVAPQDAVAVPVGEGGRARVVALDEPGERDEGPGEAPAEDQRRDERQAHGDAEPLVAQLVGQLDGPLQRRDLLGIRAIDRRVVQLDDPVPGSSVSHHRPPERG